MKPEVLYEVNGPVVTIVINRPEARNAVDRNTANQLADAFRKFEADDSLVCAVLTGNGPSFCAGADLKQMVHISTGSKQETNASKVNMDWDGDGPMGPTRMHFTKPVIAAISGYAVAGGLELAVMCDIRVAEEDSKFGVFCRRFGVPLYDGGTQRLCRLIGLSHGLDMIITGREVSAKEAHMMGLANYLVPKGQARAEAEKIAQTLATFPRKCMMSDRQCAYEFYNKDLRDALQLEFYRGVAVIQSGETAAGGGRFSSGVGRHGDFSAFNK